MTTLNNNFKLERFKMQHLNNTYIEIMQLKKISSYLWETM